MSSWIKLSLDISKAYEAFHLTQRPFSSSSVPHLLLMEAWPEISFSWKAPPCQVSSSSSLRAQYRQLTRESLPWSLIGWSSVTACPGTLEHLPQLWLYICLWDDLGLSVLSQDWIYLCLLLYSSPSSLWVNIWMNTCTSECMNVWRASQSSSAP